MLPALSNKIIAVLTYAWILLLSLDTSEQSEVHTSDILSIDRLRRDSVDSVDGAKIIETIEQLANELSLDRFLEGQLVTQTFDKSKSITTYTSVAHPAVSFKRHSIDINQDTIVLSENEDHISKISRAQLKRVYIILKKNPSAKKLTNSLYFIFYAYIRNAYSEEIGNDIIEIGNGKYVVEFDSWDNRASHTKTKLLGWLTCANSIFFSCTLNHTAISTLTPKTENKTKVVKEEMRMKPQLFTQIHPGSEDFDDSAFYPFFVDLDEFSFVESAVPSGLQKGRSLSISSSIGNKDLGTMKNAEISNGTTSNITVTFGTFFEGFQGAVGVFIPQHKGLTSMFVPDNDDTENMPLIHGLLYAAADTYNPLTFIPDKMSMVKEIKHLKGTMVPDKMMDEGIDGGIHGTLTARPNGAIFISDILPINFELDPSNADPAKVYYPVNLMKKVVNQQTGGGMTESNKTNERETAVSFATEKKENYGVLYEGNTPIFIPNGNAMAGFLIVEENSSVEAIHGTFYPTVNQNGDSFFDPDNTNSNNMTLLSNHTAKFVPDLTIKQQNGTKHTKIGIKGIYIHQNDSTGRNGTFKPDIPGKEWFFDPSNPAEGVWSPNLETVTGNKNITSDSAPTNESIPELINQPGVENTTSQVNFIEGNYYSGSLPKYGIFIPENEGVPGMIIPVSAGYSTVKGIFYSGKPSKPAYFYPEDLKHSITNTTSLPVQFTAEGITHPAQTIIGICTSTTNLTELTFWPSTPSKAYLYDTENPENSLVWTPYIPGMTETTTERYNSLQTKQLSSHEETVEDNSLYGHLFEEPGGEEGIFLPFDKSIIGTIVFSNRKYPKLPGKMIVSKNGKPPAYVADDLSLASTLINIRGIFLPDGLPRIYGGIRGYFTGGNPSGTFRTDIVGKFHVYSAEKDEDAGIWKPLVTAEDEEGGSLTSMPKNGPTAATAMLHSFVLGTYFQANQSGVSPIFVPRNGKSGFLQVLKSSTYKVHGMLYADPTPKFVSDDGIIKISNNTAVQFSPDLKRGEPSISITGKFISENAARPAVFIPSTTNVHCWSNFHMSNLPTRIYNYTYSNKKWKNTISQTTKGFLKNGIAVGGGYKGYETQGLGYDGLVEANNPIFKEFLELRTSLLGREKGKYLEIPMNIILQVEVNDPGSNFNFKSIDRLLEVINSSEYRLWLTDNYMITKTQIKTDDINQTIEIGVPVSAKSYLKIKSNQKKRKFNVIIGSQAKASSSADGTSSSNVARGGVTTSVGNCKPKVTAANAVAKASNGSSAVAQAAAKNGGVANALSTAHNGSEANSTAKVENGGTSNSKASAAGGGKASSSANNVGSGQANAVANSLTSGKQIEAVASASGKKKEENSPGGDSCHEESFVDEIVVESSAVATAIAEDGKVTGSSSANTQVRVDLAGLVAKLMTKEDEDDDTDTIDIHINAMSQSQSGRLLGPAKPKATGKKPAGKKNTKPGWKTEFRDIVPGVTFLSDEDIFYGLGNCPYVKSIYPQLLKAEKPEDIIDFYMTVLRTGCASKEKVHILMLVVDSLLEFDEKTLVIPLSHPYIKESKLTIGEMASFSRAYEISMFTKTFIWFGEHMFSNITRPHSPDGSKISKSVLFLTEYTLVSLEERIKSFPLHFIRLTRNNVMTLRTVLTKLNIDRKRLEPCEECHLDKEANYNDRIQIVSLIQFIFHGLTPISRGATDASTAFNSFYIKNKAAIRERVEVDYF